MPLHNVRNWSCCVYKLVFTLHTFVVNLQLHLWKNSRNRGIILGIKIWPTTSHIINIRNNNKSYVSNKNCDCSPYQQFLSLAIAKTNNFLIADTLEKMFKIKFYTFYSLWKDRPFGRCQGYFFSLATIDFKQLFLSIHCKNIASFGRCKGKKLLLGATMTIFIQLSLILSYIYDMRFFRS